MSQAPPDPAARRRLAGLWLAFALLLLSPAATGADDVLGEAPADATGAPAATGETRDARGAEAASDEGAEAAPDGAEGGSAEAPPRSDMAACGEAVVQRIQARYDRARDVAADFEQRTVAAAFGADAEPARGQVTFAKPGRMRWHYRTPAESLVVSDGETLWIFDPAAREVQELEVGGAFLSGAAIQFLLGEGDVAGSFVVETRRCDAEEAEIVLVPREPATYERLRVRADAATGVVRETAVLDLFGNETRVAFANVRFDQDPDPARFRFEPPEGVQVLRLEPGAQ